MKYFVTALFLTLFVFQGTALSADFLVTAMVRDFPMKSDDPVYRDYYVNAGTSNGLKQGAFIDAVRKLPIFDNVNSKFLGDTPIKIARLQIIHVDKSVCVARLVEYYSKEKTPQTGYDSVMIGDKVEVSEKQN